MNVNPPNPMKNQFIFLVALMTSFTFAHEGVELGPHGGRILEFSDNETMHGEVTVKGDKFHIALLDRDMKPVAISQQSIRAMTGDRAAPVRLEVSKDEKGFVVPLVKAGQWLILRYQENHDAKAWTARFEYNTAICDACKAAEWVCQCKPKPEEN
jgi:hypothetical protein